MATHNIVVQPAESHERTIVDNLYPLFIHDNWAYSDTLPNEFGIIGSAFRATREPARTLGEQAEMLAPYWQGSSSHHPLLIRVDGRPAGFCLLQSAPMAPEQRDHYIDEFFVLHPYRGLGVGMHVVAKVCQSRRGRWCVDMKARNRPAYQFWCRATAAISDAPVEQETLDGEFGPFVRLSFTVDSRKSLIDSD